MKGYQPKANLVKDEKGDILADYHKRMMRWKNHSCQNVNVPFFQ